MNFSIKTGLAALIAAAGLASSASAQAWTPPGPITMLIGFGAGGGADTQARLIAAELENRLGWTIIPQNVAGRGGLVLGAELLDAPADGTVIGMSATETFGYSMLAAETGWTPSQFTPLVTTAGFQMALVASATSGWTTVDDMFAAAHAGQTIRIGSITDMLTDLTILLGEANDIEFNIATIDGGGPLMNALMAGDLDAGFVAGAQTRRVAAGELVNLASAMSTPLVQTPDAPLLLDRGLPFTTDGYFFFTAPAGLPVDARNALAQAIADIVSDTSNPAGEMILAAFGGSSVIMGDELDAFVQKLYDDAGELLAIMSQ